MDIIRKPRLMKRKCKALRATDLPGMRTCIICAKMKDLEEFAKTKNGSGGYCKPCKCAKGKAAMDADPVFRLLENSKRNARAKGIEHSISRSDIIIPEYCPILRIKLTNTRGIGKGTSLSDSSVSLDRIDPTKGYISGNVQVICWKANRIKSNLCPSELDTLCKY